MSRVDNYRIACLDVYYYENYARSCCIVGETGSGERTIARYCKVIRPIQAYMPGEFYKRELPCLLAVYKEIREEIDLIIVDGFVFLEKGEKGLGAYLYAELDGKTPVIGVAKNYFRGVEEYAKLYRGQSNKPLYISCAGIKLCESTEIIQNLSGNYRIPDILKEVDRLTRVPDIRI